MHRTIHRNPEKVSDVLALVQKLFNLGRPADAAKLVKEFGTGAPELSNAYGVALMRSGAAAKAVEVYRGLCMNSSGFALKQDLPTAFKTNYATALLLTRNVSGCLELLAEIDQEADPYVQKLRAAIDRWRRSLGWWRRLAFAWYGVEPDEPVALDFLPGELIVTRELRPAA